MSFAISDVARILAESGIETHDLNGALLVLLQTEKFHLADDAEKQMPVVLSVEEDFLLQVKTPNAFRVPGAVQRAVATQCLVYQSQDPLVRWCMDSSSGELTANIDVPLKGESPSAEQIIQALANLRMVLDRRYESLTELLEGSASVAHAEEAGTETDPAVQDEDPVKGFPGLRVRDSKEGMEARRAYLVRWQCPSRTYAGRLGITALIPSFITEIEESCRKWAKTEIAAICAQIKGSKAIPSLRWCPQPLLQAAKDVWWLVPFCIWREDVASWILVNKNGIWGPNPDNGEDDISLIFSWDAVGEMDLEWEEDVVCTLTITTRESENYLTFSEFVEDGYGSQLSIIQAIYEVFEPVIEASRDESIWHHGAGNERYVSFSAADQLLEEINWVGQGLAAQFSEGQNRGQDESGRGEAARVTEDESHAELGEEEISALIYQLFGEVDSERQAAKAKLKAAQITELFWGGSHPLTDSDLLHVADLSSLEKVELYMCAELTAAGFAHLSKLSSLKSITLCEAGQLTDSWLPILSGFKDLECLNLGIGCGRVGDAGLRCLGDLGRLTEASLCCGNVTDEGLSHLSRLTKLVELHLSGIENLTGAGLLHLAPISGLKTLKLSGGSVLGDAHLVHLCQLPGLRKLALWQCAGLSSIAVTHLSELENIESLRIDLSGLTEISLCDLVNLKDLDIGGAINVEGIDLGGCAGLSKLNIENAEYDFIDGSMQALKEPLTKLRRLSLRNCSELTDEALRYSSDSNFDGALDSLINLIFLDLRGCTSMTQGGVDELQALLPDCDVRSDPMSIPSQSAGTFGHGSISGGETLAERVELPQSSAGTGNISSEFSAVVETLQKGAGPYQTSVRELLSWFGAKRRGSRVTAQVRQALARSGLITFPDFEEAPMDGGIELRRERGGGVFVETTPTAGLSKDAVEASDVEPVVEAGTGAGETGAPGAGAEPSDTGREFWAAKSSAASMEALDFVLEILREKVSDVDLVYQKYRIHPRSGQHICRLIRLTPQKSALMIQLTMPETEYWSKRLGREGMNARFLERDGFYRLNATLESTRSHRLLWKELLFHLWDASTGTDDGDASEGPGLGDRLRGLFKGR
ncbi:MAG: hypothetical protein HOM68_19715 [Gemmatimonadetes bacterium]|nr:hypothetical protein [Gemmatimonadota bacterium]